MHQSRCPHCFFEPLDDRIIPKLLQSYERFNYPADFDRLVRWLKGTSHASHLSTNPPVTQKNYQPPYTAYEPAWYVDPETQQKEALRCLHWPGKPIMFRGPRFSGKTWLMKHILEVLKKEVGEFQIVHIDLCQAKSGMTSLESLLRHTVEQMGLRLGATEAAVARLWDGNGGIPSLKATNAMGQFLLHANCFVVMTIEGLDQVVDNEVRETFFSALRAWLDSRTDPGWENLRVLMSSSTMRFKKEDINRSSVAGLFQEIVVDKIEETQVKRLAALYELNWTDTELHSVTKFVGGKPHLIRTVMYLAAVNGHKLPTLLAPGAETFNLHLSWIRERIKLGDLGTHLHDLQRETPMRLSCAVSDHLYRLGLIRQEQADRYRLSCPLYKRL